jgi:predicted dinucleotide-binding enzyme
MNIGIIGTGNIGTVLTRQLTSLGHNVSIANSRGPDTLTELASETGAKAATVEEAASAKDLVIITIPEPAVASLPRAILSTTKAIVVDTGNYFPSRDGQIAEIDGGLPDSEWVSKTIGHDVIKAFNNIVTESLKSKATPSEKKNRVALAVSGNSADERETVMNLINEIGFDAVDNGTLSESWRHQPGSPAYCNDLNADDLRTALRQAERDQVPLYREAENEKVRLYLEKMREQRT